MSMDNDFGIRHVLAIALSTMFLLPSLAFAETVPSMAGGFTNVIPIPVDDPTTKAIAGALFKPRGSGPFPAVVYMVGCDGLGDIAEQVLAKITIDHLLAKGVATLIVDPFTPRSEPEGVCAKLTKDKDTVVQYLTRGGNDAVAALKVVKAMPDIDPKRIFLQGYSYGAVASLFAVDAKFPTHDSHIAGLIAYYPYCYDNVDPSVPTLALIGEKDDWAPAALCQKVTGEPNFEVAVFPHSYHAFVEPRGQPVDLLGHHLAYNEKTALDAQRRADAFMDARMK
jgi:dienelactone hydrolase